MTDGILFALLLCTFVGGICGYWYGYYQGFRRAAKLCGRWRG